MAINAGGIGFISYSSDGSDDFSFIVLEDIAAGEVLNFTDRGIFYEVDVGIEEFIGPEQIVTWTNNTGAPIPAGTVVDFIDNVGFSVGATSGDPGLGLAQAGDQIIVYQDVSGSPTSFVAMIHMNGDYEASATNTNTSKLPFALTDGIHAISIAPEVDNAAYTGPTTPTDADGWRLRLFDEANWTGDDLSANSSSVTGSSVTVSCFLAGTMIATPGGEVAVETLEIGDKVLTADGRTTPVKWVGRQTVSTRFGPATRNFPVRISAGALGRGTPHRDLTVTADHGMVLGGYVIDAAALVNGSTIDFVPLAELGEAFTVYHIEAPDHDVILANGAPSETFIDYVGRAAFDNYDEYLALYGAERIIPELPQPRISAARHVPAHIAQRLGITAGPDFDIHAPNTQALCG
ncbi:Hint domain-containing protein [Pseudaestuariivita atlantica]|uniref:Hint domain-containing protein n=1 Tax=Pseudaestuariivita atlantica TaxID=1317121 RepID=UPI00067C84C9|nr:Hint domain-containing protein [Pseudaestuariivita atlantica]